MEQHTHLKWTFSRLKTQMLLDRFCCPRVMQATLSQMDRMPSESLNSSFVNRLVFLVILGINILV